MLSEDIPQGGPLQWGRLSARDEMVQLVVAAQAEPRRHGLEALALAGPDQAPQVDGCPPPPLLVAQPRHERLEPVLKLLAPVHTRHDHRPETHRPGTTAQPPSGLPR